MTDAIQAYSKAITALLTSLAMAYLRAHLDLAGLGIEGPALTVISMSFDGASALVIGFMTWLIPIGAKYWHQTILGERVSVVTVNHSTGAIQTVEGTVVSVPRTGAELSPAGKADAMDSEAAR